MIRRVLPAYVSTAVQLTKLAENQLNKLLTLFLDFLKERWRANTIDENILFFLIYPQGISLK